MGTCGSSAGSKNPALVARIKQNIDEAARNKPSFKANVAKVQDLIAREEKNEVGTAAV